MSAAFEAHGVTPCRCEPGTPASSTADYLALDRRLYLILSVIALVYSLFAGLRTLSDFDLGLAKLCRREGRPREATGADEHAANTETKHQP